MSVERHAAAHRDGLAGHVGIIHEQHHSFCDLVSFTEASQWYPTDKFLLTLHHVCFDQRRRDSVDGDPFLDQASRVPAGQSLKACFRCIVVGPDRASSTGGA